jgi:hypothetical protein
VLRTSKGQYAGHTQASNGGSLGRPIGLAYKLNICETLSLPASEAWVWPLLSEQWGDELAEGRVSVTWHRMIHER